MSEYRLWALCWFFPAYRLVVLLFYCFCKSSPRTYQAMYVLKGHQAGSMFGYQLSSSISSAISFRNSGLTDLHPAIGSLLLFLSFFTNDDVLCSDSFHQGHIILTHT